MLSSKVRIRFFFVQFASETNPRISSAWRVTPKSSFLSTWSAAHLYSCMITLLFGNTKVARCCALIMTNGIQMIYSTWQKYRRTSCRLSRPNGIHTTDLHVLNLPTLHFADAGLPSKSKSTTEPSISIRPLLSSWNSGVKSAVRAGRLAVAPPMIRY